MTETTTNLPEAPAAIKLQSVKAPPVPYGALPDEISWRSKVFDAIGRTLFGTPEKLGVGPAFYYIAADRPQSKALYSEMVRDNVRDQHIRRELRALIAHRMLVVGAIVIVVSFMFTGSYTSALATSAANLFN
ncbi:hypothetical protein [Burkholderia cepacia]|uniref:hypothetical protein n=1 Tax=Burkholderia cepacia TaxID=292 RepID=UPI00158B53DD|nr:hypothetical protein [Burkholderia cepacia]MCA8162015.1 hypothetical protein [Burkholderia cepacia]